MIEGKVALVTGSTSGIGFAIANALAREGALVMVNGSRSQAEIDATARTLAEATGSRVVGRSADMADVSAIESLVRTTEEELGPIDILVNNAGLQHVSPIEDFPTEKWDKIIAVNLSAAMHAIRLNIGGMKKRGWGRIINIASAHALVASPFKAAYVAAKHGLLGLTKVAAVEAAEYDVTCNAICPGYVWTPLVANQIADQAKAHDMPEDRVIREVILAPQPNRQFAEADEIAALAIFLCSDSGRSITGAALPVDGGWTAR